MYGQELLRTDYLHIFTRTYGYARFSNNSTKRMTLFLLEYFESLIAAVASYFYLGRFSLTFDMENIDDLVLSVPLRKRVKYFSLHIYYFTEF